MKRSDDVYAASPRPVTNRAQRSVLIDPFVSTFLYSTGERSIRATDVYDVCSAFERRKATQRRTRPSTTNRRAPRASLYHLFSQVFDAELFERIYTQSMFVRQNDTQNRYVNSVLVRRIVSRIPRVFFFI